MFHDSRWELFHDSRWELTETYAGYVPYTLNEHRYYCTPFHQQTTYSAVQLNSPAPHAVESATLARRCT